MCPVVAVVAVAVVVVVEVVEVEVVGAAVVVAAVVVHLSISKWQHLGETVVRIHDVRSNLEPHCHGYPISATVDLGQHGRHAVFKDVLRRGDQCLVAKDAFGHDLLVRHDATQQHGDGVANTISRDHLVTPMGQSLLERRPM